MLNDTALYILQHTYVRGEFPQQTIWRALNSIDDTITQKDDLAVETAKKLIKQLRISNVLVSVDDDVDTVTFREAMSAAAAVLVETDVTFAAKSFIDSVRANGGLFLPTHFLVKCASGIDATRDVSGDVSVDVDLDLEGALNILHRVYRDRPPDAALDDAIHTLELRLLDEKEMARDQLVQFLQKMYVPEVMLEIDLETYMVEYLQAGVTVVELPVLRAGKAVAETFRRARRFAPTLYIAECVKQSQLP